MPLLIVAVVAVIAMIAVEAGKSPASAAGGNGTPNPNPSAGSDAAKDVKDALTNIGRPSDATNLGDALPTSDTDVLNNAGEAQAAKDNYGLGDQYGTGPSTSGDSTGAQLAKTVAGLVVVAAAAGAGAYAGAKVGEATDKALGGTGGGVTGTVAQAGTATAVGAGAAAGAAVGLSALGAGAFFATLAGIAGPVALAALAVTVVVYTIGSVVSDLNRLSYGQAGARRDYDKLWQATHDRLFTALRMAIPLNVATNDQIERIIIPLTDGYLRSLNDYAFIQWQKRGGVLIGQNLSPYDHAQFGSDRGYFLGIPKLGVNASAAHLVSTALLQEVDVVIRSYDQGYVIKYVPVGQQKTVKQVINPPKAAIVKAVQARGKVSTEDAITDLSSKSTVITYVADGSGVTENCQQAGRDLANIGRYQAWMTSSDAKGKDPVARCKDGIAQGEFVGNATDGGRLLWKGATFDFRNPGALANVIKS